MVYQCRVCSSHQIKKTFIATEVRQKTNEEFTYFRCDCCGCVQIAIIPVNIEKYYDNYYSLASVEKSNIAKSFFRKKVFKYRLFKTDIFGKLITIFKPEMFNWIEPKMFNFHSKILDVGSGNGSLLVKMSESGFKNLAGVDLFINDDIIYNVNKNEIGILKKDISEIKEKYDFIMLHHVIEHIPNQHDFFNNIKKIMHSDSKLVFVLPIVSDILWDIYGINGFQFEDTPRHFYIHSKKSLNYLFKYYGFKIDKMKSFFEDKVMKNIYNINEIKNPMKLKKSLMNKQDTGLMVYYLSLDLNI